MRTKLSKKRSFAIVGAGRLGSALARALKRAGYQIDEIVVRDRPQSLRKGRELAKAIGARVADVSDAVFSADVVWLCVPDREIGSVARTIALRRGWKNKIALHSSGALTSGELSPLRKQGTSIASVHPLMTFVASTTPDLRGVPFAIEGDARAVRSARLIVRALGGDAFAIDPRKKAAYHAWGSFASPMLVSLLASAEEMARLAGISPRLARKRMLPIVRQTLANYAALGPARALTGPIVRGDAAVVRQHLNAMNEAPNVRQVYIALTRVALKRLYSKHKKELSGSLQDLSRKRA